MRACARAQAEPMTQLLKDMLSQQLSFRLIEVILDAGAVIWRAGGGGASALGLASWVAG